MLAWLSAVSTHALWWIGLVLTIEPALQKLLPTDSKKWLEAHVSRIHTALSSRWFHLIGAILIVVSFYQAWNDEHKNTQLVIDQRAVDVSHLNECSQDLRLTRTRLADLEKLRDDKQQGFDAEQTNLTSCLTQLGKKLEPKKPQVVARFDAFTWLNTPHPMSEMVLVTNQTIVPARVLISCDNSFGVTPRIGGAQNVTMMRQQRVSSKEIIVEIESPAWSPTSPLLLLIQSNGGDVITQCGYRVLN